MSDEENNIDEVSPGLMEDVWKTIEGLTSASDELASSAGEDVPREISIALERMEEAEMWLFRFVNGAQPED